MNLKEFDEFRMTDAVKFNSTLNPALFDGDGKLKADVREQLLAIADDFMDHLGVKNIEVKDITLSGSNAAYTYTPHSDIDLHILVDIAKLKDDEIYRELFNSKKVVYNDTHDIKIGGYDVELYVQDSGEPVKSLGEYSVARDKWIKFPSKRRSGLDEYSAREKFKKLVQLSELALRSRDLKQVENLLATIRKYRQAGLAEHGEFGAENLAYKALRSRGIVDQLYKHRDILHSKKLSLREKEAAAEDYHPNDTPPGPEFKPTMPKGTVRVDVSDVYDWYKLGQHISNLKGLGKHDFGKGPPSTILSFGDEDTEHRYIQDLMKTGLSTTDIDPPGHKKIKGQKVDPTYNVSEDQLTELIQKTTKGWSHYGFGYPEEQIHPLPKWNKFENMNRQTPGSGYDICRYMNFLVHDSSTMGLDITGNEIASVMTKMYGTNSAKELSAVNKRYGQDFESWDEILDVYREIELQDRAAALRESASGYIPSDAEKDDPRFKTALTVDIKPDTLKKNAKKLGLGKIHRSGVPPIARSNGKV